jgi:hypothetical protein
MAVDFMKQSRGKAVYLFRSVQQGHNLRATSIKGKEISSNTTNLQSKLTFIELIYNRTYIKEGRHTNKIIHE